MDNEKDLVQSEKTIKIDENSFAEAKVGPIIIKEDIPSQPDLNEKKYIQPEFYQNSITKSILALSVIIALLIGMIGGFFYGESRAEAKIEKYIASGIYAVGNSNNSDNDDNQQTSNNDEDENAALYASIDYENIKINDEYTIESFYSDDETRYYASKVIGKELPELTWVDSNGTTHSTTEYKEGDYLLELFSSSCTYCNKSISEVDSYREKSGNTVISLCLDDGDITNFNSTGEHAWAMANINADEISTFLEDVPWIPTMLYIHDGTIMLANYGATSVDELTRDWNTAFGK